MRVEHDGWFSISVDVAFTESDESKRKRKIKEKRSLRQEKINNINEKISS